MNIHVQLLLNDPDFMLSLLCARICLGGETAVVTLNKVHRLVVEHSLAKL